MRLGDDIYPCTIIRDRYGGVYSGGEWLAWPLPEDEVPEGPSDSDVACANFWGLSMEAVGRGINPSDAYQDLLARYDN